MPGLIAFCLWISEEPPTHKDPFNDDLAPLPPIWSFSNLNVLYGIGIKIREG